MKISTIITFNKRIFLSSYSIIILIFSVVFGFSTCSMPSKNSAAANLTYSDFSGSKSCQDCHKQIYDSFINTSHHNTSGYADTNNIKGSFDSAKNSFYYNANVMVAMEKKDNRLFETEYSNGHKVFSAPFDITVGSGKRGQTYLYWNKNRLIQLPISYFTAIDEWTNSPGFSNKVVFNRPATSRCLECHSTYLHKTSDTTIYPEEFSKTEVVLGVECERCHGPAKKHVEFHQQNPADKNAHFVVNTGKMPRQYNMELCRFCHGGKLVKSQPSFSYIAGSNLNDFFAVTEPSADPGETDVHGNQFAMLYASKCFQKSQMTCTSCHDPHKNEINEKQYFSQKCMKCHTAAAGNISCKIINKKNAATMETNCIDCHMPEQLSKTIMILRQGDNIPLSATMRSHYIAVYKNAGKEQAMLREYLKIKK